MQAAADAFLAELSPGTVDVEPRASKLAEDMIFRTLFLFQSKIRPRAKYLTLFEPISVNNQLPIWLRWCLRCDGCHFGKIVE